VFGVELSNCRSEIDSGPYLERGMKRCRKVGFQYGCQRAYPDTDSVSEGHRGDTRCKDYIPHFQMAGQVLVC